MPRRCPPIAEAEPADPWLPGLRRATAADSATDSVGPNGGMDTSDTALVWDGRSISAAQVRDRGRVLLSAAGPASRPWRIGRLAVPDQVAALVAAAQARRPVLLDDPEHPLPELTAPPDGSYLVVATSGSSGRPRAIARTLASWTGSFPAYSQLTALRRDDVLLLTGPLTSTMQSFAALHAWSAGLAVTDDPSIATAVTAVPATLERWWSLPRLRTVIVAGAHLPASADRIAADRGLRLVEVYGSAEQSFVAARVAPGRLRPFTGVQVRVRDGTLWSRSPWHALGRLTAPDDHRPTALPGDDAGFVSVGDRGRCSEDGTLTVLGRGDTALSVGGRTVLVEEIESVIGALPGVRAVAVAGQHHPRWGEVPVALLELESGGELPRVRATARRLLDKEHLPRRWLPTALVPRTAGGKIDRAAVARLLAAAAGADPADG